MRTDGVVHPTRAVAANSSAMQTPRSVRSPINIHASTAVAVSVGASPSWALKSEAGAKVSRATRARVAAALDGLPIASLNVSESYKQTMVRQPTRQSDRKGRVALRDQNHEAPAIRFGQSAAPKDQPKRRVS